MTTGILVHGCNLGAFRWEHIVWGEPPHRLGRVTRGLLILLQEEYLLKREVAALVMGTGVVWTGGGKRDGCMEAHETRKILFERLSEVSKFSVFQQQFPAVLDENFLAQLKSRLERITVLATDCQNTAQEIRDAARIFRERGADRIILASSPSHLPRCVKEACLIFEDADYAPLRYNLFAAPSDTCYQDTTAANVAIFEPPHRPDRPMYPINQFVRRISNVADDRMPRFLKDLDELLEGYGA